MLPKCKQQGKWCPWADRRLSRIRRIWQFLMLLRLVGGTDTGALRHLGNTPGNRLRRKNQVGQPLSHRGWQDGGVKVTNGVLELWSKGVMEARDAQPFCDAGPEAGVPTQPRKRSEVGKGGKEAGKWTGFSRLFPHNSTQVVDFQRMSVVSIFLKDEKQLNLVRGIPSGAW